MDRKIIKICVTGSNGFIGSNLLKCLSKNRKFEIVSFNGNLLDKKDIEIFFGTHKKIDQLVHLAGGFYGDFNTLFLVNVTAINNLLEQAVKHSVNKIVFASSGAVYGEPVREKSTENDPLNPNTLYGLSKMFAEECIKYYLRSYNLEFVILRFSNVYGQGNSKGVIYNFLKSIKEKNKVTIFGTGKQKRNFLFVEDATRSIISALEYTGTEIFNIADKNIYSLRDVVKILKNSGLKFEVEYQPAETANALQVLSEDITKAKSEMRWEPQITLDAGISKLISNTKI